MVELLYSKIHRATVTSRNVNYEGSITISKHLVEAAKIYEYEKVTIANVSNGNRFDTYVIVTDVPNTICVNGAAAHLVNNGDKIIIMSYRIYNDGECINHKPIIVKVGINNQIEN